MRLVLLRVLNSIKKIAEAVLLCNELRKIPTIPQLHCCQLASFCYRRLKLQRSRSACYLWSLLEPLNGVSAFCNVFEHQKRRKTVVSRPLNFFLSKKCFASLCALWVWSEAQKIDYATTFSLERKWSPTKIPLPCRFHDWRQEYNKFSSELRNLQGCSQRTWKFRKIHLGRSKAAR